MGLSTIVVIITAIIIGLGLRAILRDWRNKFKEDAERARIQRKAQQQRNRTEAKKSDVVTLERDKDGVYRPKKDD